MRIDLDQARARRRDAARTEARQAGSPAAGNAADEIVGNRGSRAERAPAAKRSPKRRSNAVATRDELVDARCNRALAAKLRGALAVRRVVRVRIAVLDDRCLIASARLRRRGSHPSSPGSRRPQPVRRCGVRCPSSRCSAGESLQASSSRHQSVARRPAARHASSSRSSASQPVASAPHSGGFAAVLPPSGAEFAPRGRPCAAHASAFAAALAASNSASRTAVRAAPSLSKSKRPKLVARSRVVHGASERFRRQRSIVDDDRKTEFAQPLATRALLGLAVAGERYEHRPRAARHDVQRRVVARLRYGNERAAQQACRSRRATARRSRSARRDRAAAACPLRGCWVPPARATSAGPKRECRCAASAVASSSMPTPPPPAETTTSSRPRPAHRRRADASRRRTRNRCNEPAATSSPANENVSSKRAKRRSPCTKIASNQRAAQPSISRSRSGLCCTCRISRIDPMISGRGRDASMRSSRGKSSKRSERRPNGNVSNTTASGRASAYASSSRSRRRARDMRRRSG